MSNGSIAVLLLMKGSGFLPILLAALTPFLILTLIISAVGFEMIAWKPPVLWSEKFGGSGGANSATVIGSDLSGAYVQGYINSSYLGLGSGSLFLTKYDPAGDTVWTRTIGDTNTSYIDSLSVGPDGLYMSGGYIGGVTLLKYDFSGKLSWAKQFAVTGGLPGASSVSSNGFYFAGVSTTQLPNESYSGVASFLRSYDLTGNLVWTREFFNGSALIRGVYASSSGVYVAGNALTPLPGQTQGGDFLLKYDSAGDLAWIRQVADGNYGGVAGDSTGVYASGSSLRKYDFNGGLSWAIQIESPDSSALDGSWLSVDSSGIYLSFSTVRRLEFLVKYDLSSNRIWNLQMQQPREDFSLGLAYRLSSGPSGVYVAGTVNDVGFLQNRALVALIGSSASLVFFSINPPLSFIILGGLIAGSVASLFLFWRLRRRRIRPSRVGLSSRVLPATD